MPRRLTIAERLKLINLLLAGTPRKEIRKSFRFNSEEFRSTVRSCFPNKVGALLANELSKEERDSIQAYLVDVAKLEDIKHQCEASGKSFLLEATEDLMAFFGPNSFPDSDISRQIAFYCLGGLDHLTKAIVDTRRSLLAPVARVPADEACMLLEFLEELAAYYGGKRLLADICEMKKIRGFVLLASRRLREAAMCFEEALPFARQAFGGPQLQYLQFFQHVIAHRADWLELDVLSAHDHLKNAIAIFPAEKIDTILKGYYWGLGDLERDEILLDATEAALGGDAVRSSGLMEMWLQQSATLSHKSPRYPHFKTIELLLRWLAATGPDQRQTRGSIRPEMLARMETRDIRRRTDLYCVHILDTARTGTAIADATKQAGTVLSPDAFPPGGTKQIVEELAIEVDTRASDLLYLPEWLVSWSQGTDAQHQSYALETYAGVIAEFWSTATGLASNNFRSPACRGIAWSLATLEAIDLVVLREQQADLLKSIVELLRLHFARPTDSLTDPPQPTEAAPSVWQIIQRTAPSLFPHVTELGEEVTIGKAVQTLFRRLWQKPVESLSMPVSKSGFRGGYYYLSPWFNFYEQNMYQPDPNEHVDVFYAENYGQPSTDMVVLVTEGESGKAAFDFLLGNLFPRWKVLKLKVLNGRGAGQTVLAAEVIKETGAGYILAPDKDAEPFYARMGEQPDWKATIAAMNNAPKSYLDPDLEGVNPTALVATIKELNPRAKFDESAVMNELGQYVVDVRSGARPKKTGGTLAFATELIRKHWEAGPSLHNLDKDAAWGRALAAAWLKTEIPASVAHCLDLALGAARGLRQPAQPFNPVQQVSGDPGLTSSRMTA